MAILCPINNITYFNTLARNCISVHGNYFIPLHVDCSVEYELPNSAKFPFTIDNKNEPLLVIHPLYNKRDVRCPNPFLIDLSKKIVKNSYCINQNHDRNLKQCKNKIHNLKSNCNRKFMN